MGDVADFALAVEERGDAVVVRVDGELDMAHAAVFEDALATAPEAQHVVLDLTGCTLLDSTGLRVITATTKARERVSVVATEPAILRVLEITSVETLVTIHPSLDAAL